MELANLIREVVSPLTDKSRNATFARIQYDALLEKGPLLAAELNATVKATRPDLWSEVMRPAPSGAYHEGESRAHAARDMLQEQGKIRPHGGKWEAVTRADHPANHRRVR